MTNIDIHNLPLSSENYSLIWIENQSNSSEEIKQAQQQVRSSINRLRIFKNVDECINNVRSSDTDQIILVVNVELSETVIPHLHELSQIIAIYIYNITDDQQIQFLNRYSKVNFNSKLISYFQKLSFTRDICFQ